eukprot:Stramenopile-MAST_4_protein_927
MGDSDDSESVFLYAPWRACPPPDCHQPYWRLLKRGHLEGNIRGMTPKTLGNLMWGCALTQKGSTKMFDELSKQAMEKLDYFSCRDVANFVWGMVGVRYQHHDLLTRVVKYCSDRLHEFDPDSIALTMHALSSIEGISGITDMVQRSFVPLSEMVEGLSGSGCAKMWQVLCKQQLFHDRFVKHLDARTEYWAHVLVSEEVGNCIFACSILKYRPGCLVPLVGEAFKIFAVILEEAEVARASGKVEVADATAVSTVGDSTKTENALDKLEYTNGVHKAVTAKEVDLKASPEPDAEVVHGMVVEKRHAPSDTHTFFRIVLEGFSVFRIDQIDGLMSPYQSRLLAACGAAALRALTFSQVVDATLAMTSLHIYDVEFFSVAWELIEKNKSIGNKELASLICVDDVLAKNDSRLRGSDEFQQWLKQTSQERSMRPMSGKRSSCLEQVTELLFEMDEHPDHTVRNVDVALLEKKVGVRFYSDDAYLISRGEAMLGKPALGILQMECKGWTIVPIRERVFNRIATLIKKKQFLKTRLGLKTEEELEAEAEAEARKMFATSGNKRNQKNSKKK